MNINTNTFKSKLNNKVLRNSVIYTISESLSKLVPFLTLPIITMYLTPSDYGIVATYTALVSIIAVFVQLSLTGAINVSYFKLDKDELKIYIANTFFILLISTSVVLLILLFFLDSISTRLNLASFWIVIAVFSVLLQTLITTNLVLWQAEQNAKKYAIYQILFMIVNTVMVIACVVLFKLGWKGQIIGKFLAIFSFSILSFIVIIKRGYFKLNIRKEYIYDALKFGVPLIPHVLSGWFKTGVDRLFLTSFVGASATGIYSLSYQLGMVVAIVTIAFNQAFSQFLYRKLTDINYDYKLKLVKYTYLYFVMIILFALFVSFIMPWFIINFIDEKYKDAIELLPWVAFGFAFQGMYYMVVNYIFYVKKTFSLSVVTFTGGVLHVIFSYFLIHLYGQLGAAYATTLSSFITFVLVWILSNKVYSMPWALNLLKRGK